MSSDHQGRQRLQNKSHRSWQIEGRFRTVYQLMNIVDQLLILSAKSFVHSSVVSERRADDSELTDRLSERIHLQTSATCQIRKWIWLKRFSCDIVHWFAWGQRFSEKIWKSSYDRFEIRNSRSIVISTTTDSRLQRLHLSHTTNSLDLTIRKHRYVRRSSLMN